MIKAKHLLGLLIIIGIMTFTVNAQNKTDGPNGPSAVGQLTYKFVPSIKEQMRLGTFIPADPLSESQKMGRPKLRHGNRVVPGKGSKGPDILAENQMRASQLPTRATSLVFTTTSSTATPSDPTGAVGLDYYVASWNTSWQIFNKDGTPATSAASLATLFGESPGDPIVLYDAAADRYIITQFSGSPNGFHVAISQTNNPVNSGWHVYSSSDFQTGAFPDYTKFSIWSDGYYVTANISGGNGEVWALERDEMLDGDPAGIQAFFLPGLETNGFYSPQAFHVTDDNLPATGSATFVYMQDDAWLGVDNDHIKLWNLDIDWANPLNSQMSQPTELPVTPFVGVFDGGGFSNLTQPTGGPDIDCLQGTIMNQAQFRKFPSYNSAIFNFVVDAGTGGNELAAVRWYELRQSGDGQPWSIHQEGTYVAPDERHAWAASMAMDGSGNIGMGYTTMGGTEGTLITSAYTGQFFAGPTGVMNAIEEFIQTSTAGNTNLRYADYTHLTLDPSDDATFWFVDELFTPSRSNVVGVFRLTQPQRNDVSISAITAPSDGVLGSAEQITVSIRNIGTNDQTNIPVSYTINGGSPVNEVYTGTILAGVTESYMFSTTADLSINNQTYTLEACTNLGNDLVPSNDCKTLEVTNSVIYCQPTANCSFGDGITAIEFGDISLNTVPCTSGYADLRSNSTDLIRISGSNVHNGVFQTGFAPEELSMWIDFNDDGDFDDPGEQVVDTFEVEDGDEDTDQPFSITIPTDANLGPHIFRIRGIDPAFSGDLNEPCDDMAFGNTVDFTVNITDPSLAIDEFDSVDSSLNIITKPDDQFEITLSTPFSEKLTLSVFNTLGQQVVFNVIEKSTAGAYVYRLDMSYAASGIYLVKVGRGNNFKSGKIIVR